MAAADGQRAGNAHAGDPNKGERRLSLTEGLVLCLVSEGSTYGLTVTINPPPGQSDLSAVSVPATVEIAPVLSPARS